MHARLFILEQESFHCTCLAGSSHLSHSVLYKCVRSVSNYHHCRNNGSTSAKSSYQIITVRPQILARCQLLGSGTGLQKEQIHVQECFTLWTECKVLLNVGCFSKHLTKGVEKEHKHRIPNRPPAPTCSSIKSCHRFVRFSCFWSGFLRCLGVGPGAFASKLVRFSTHQNSREMNRKLCVDSGT